MSLMPARKNDPDDNFLSKDEERRIGEGLKRALISDNPNPDRIGCPEPKILRDLAFHKKLRDPKLFEEVTTHMARCSACVRDALAYGEEYKEEKRKQRANRIVLTIAATLALAVAVWTAWYFQTTDSDPEHAGKGPQPTPESPKFNNGEGQQKKEPQVTEYQTASIELPSRWRGDLRAELPKFVLSRGNLLVTVRLPVGSPEGKYRFRILDHSKRVLVVAQNSARIESGTTALKVPLDTSALSAGSYTVSVLEPGMDEWVEYSLVIK
jgi:hypothetical protein